MRIAVTGASGFLGSAAVRGLRADGHEVRRLVRGRPDADDEARWDPTAGTVDLDALADVEAVVHLAGAGVGDRRWTTSYMEEIRSSRVNGTRTISEACAAMSPRPRVLLCGSAIGYYGDTGEQAVDESHPSGAGFLAAVVRDWEAATRPASEAGVRAAHLRTGIVLSGAGGTLGGVVHAFGVPIRLLSLFKLGLGGPLGSGRQWVSWMSLTDWVRALRHVLASNDAGPINLVAPTPVRNREWVHAIGRAVQRPAVLPVPAVALRVAVGRFADEGVLVSQRVLPRRLSESGLEFRHADIDAALAAELVDED